MKYKGFIASAVATIAILGISNAKANAAESLNLDYNVNATQINLEWNDTGDSYKIYNGESLIWQGTDTHFIVKDLSPNYNYNISLVSVEDGKDTDIKKISTTTSSVKSNKQVRALSINTEEKNTEASLLEDVNIDAIIESDMVKLKINGTIPDDDNQYEVLKDNNYIADLKDSNTFVDSDIEPGQTYNYTFIGKTRLSEEEISAIKKEYEEKNIELTKEIEDMAFYKPYEFHRIVKVPSLVEKKAIMLKAVSYKYQYNFRYKTFIPDAKVPAMSIFQGLAGYDFEGDNRGFSFSSNKYRTLTEAKVTFTNSGSSVSLSKDVGWSSLLKPNGAIKEQRKASTDDMKLTKTSSSTSKITFKITHSGTIPFGVAPAIDYTYNATVYKDGGFNITGTRDQAPSHEFYAYSPNSDLPILTLFQSKNKGFQYLLPPMANAEIKESM
ncbi:DUF3238 domain-containing protein [Niallia taxi]|uniref:DUF3238 domain-containing protein n=1 Tax=Niallia taxi TaxID=2499688 RepID=UPI00317F3181